MQPEEYVLEEACIFDTILEEQADQQGMLDILDEELTECAEEQEKVDMKFVQGYWRRRNEIFPLVIGEKISEPQKIDFKPLPVELKYAYLKTMNNAQWSFQPYSALHRRVACCKSSNRTRKPLGGEFLI